MLWHGTFLARRWEDESGVNLYHCADEGRGFYVEVRVSDEHLLVLRRFVSAKPLEGYAPYVRLPT